jgi:hypothetical protein
MMTEEFPAVRAIYNLYGKPENVNELLLDAPHNYNLPNREAMYAFFAKHVLGDPEGTKYRERNVDVEKLQDMLALHNRKLPDNAVTFRQLFEQWKRLSTQQTGNERERLTWALAAEWPSQVAAEGAGEQLVLGRPGKGDRIAAIWIKGANPPALVVDPDGAAAARTKPEVESLIRAGRSVLLIDAFQTGSAVAPRNRSVKMFLTFNKSDDANRVQDILTALAWLKTPEATLIGLGKAAVWCLFAAAVAPQKVALANDAAALGDFFVPGIERAGGITAARALARR